MASRYASPATLTCRHEPAGRRSRIGLAADGQTIESAERLGARFAEREGARERGAATRTGARYGERQIVEHFPIKRGVKRAAGVLRAQLITPAKRAASPSSGRKKKSRNPG